MSSSLTYLTDTAFWLGLLNSRDQHHPRVLQWQQHLVAQQALLLVPELVLWELLNAMAAPDARRQAMGIYRPSFQDPRSRVVMFEGQLRSDALALYESRHDKAWSLTDCFSMTIMRSHGVTGALTTDHHFEQAAFDALLMRDPI